MLAEIRQDKRMKTKTHYCLDQECHSLHKSTPAPHTMMGIVQCTTGTAMEEEWRCDRCGYRHQSSISRRRCHKRTWPYHNESAGVTFESESHEQKYCAANNLTPINK
jgi:hypothetical protein